MTLPTDLERMNAKGLVEELKRLHKQAEDRTIVFLLGAGASRSSGIPTGVELARTWLKEMHHGDPRGDGKLDLWAWATPEHLGPGFEGLEEGRVGEFYTRLFSRRFRRDKASAYPYLESIMEGSRPSLGYMILAKILSETRHRVVVTTNFDSLVTDALAEQGGRHPLVCGHESLADFAHAKPRRPLVAKIHHDLFLGPRNTTEETCRLPDPWVMALNRLLHNNVLVVIGYGGNDGSLMGYLDKVDFSTTQSALYWCQRRGDTPQGEVVNLLRDKSAPLIDINGFDELMLELGQVLLKDPLNVVAMAGDLVSRAQEAAERLKQAADDLGNAMQKAEEPKAPQSAETPQAAEAKEERKAALAILGEATPGQESWWKWQQRIDQETDPESKKALYQEALKALPESHELTGNFAIFMTDVRGNPDEVEHLFRRALELHPNHANHTGNFASFLLTTGRLAEGRALAQKALSLRTDAFPVQTRAEALYYLALTEEYRSSPWLAELKALIVKGYPRDDWSFERLQAALFPDMPEEKRTFFGALGAAILDADKVAALDAFPEWRDLEPKP